MQNTDETRDRMILDFTENYLGKLYYFCLKRTGNGYEADDLTQDISLNILAALNKGTVPANFPAWVWQIAYNRYSVWAKAKHDRNESVTGSDIGDYEIEDESGNILDGMIRTEQMALIRRELAFIKSDYRKIVVAYYLEDKNVREIASELSLSVNTVKSRLLRAREKLKEGMDMARTFGKRSFNPEDITFAASGSQPSGLPWRAVGRRIPNNILLQASNNPSTVEELSVELGIALPYMEEEVALLHDATLLEMQGDRYITNFFILDKDCRTEVYRALRSAAKERSRMLREFITEKTPDLRALGIVGAHVPDNVLRWWLVPYLTDELIAAAVAQYGESEPQKRANGESWGFVGYEAAEIPEEISMGHNGCGNGKNMFWAYKIRDYGMWEQCGEPNWNTVMAICDVIRDQCAVSAYHDAGRIRLNDGKYYHIEEDRLIPDIPVLTSDEEDRIRQMLREHRNHAPLLQNVKDAYLAVEEIFKKYSHEVLHKSMAYYICMELYAMRMMAIHDLVEEGFLTLPEDPAKSNLGMHLIMK